MNHDILWASMILGSFIMQALHRWKDEGGFSFLWMLVGMTALFAGIYVK